MKSFNLRSSKSLISLISIFIAILTILPLIGLLMEGFHGLSEDSIFLILDTIKQVKGTLLLVILTALLGGSIGTVNGWLLSNCRFKGRKLFKIFQLIPFACPAYLLSATLIDLGSINSIRIHGLGWGVVIMSLTTYPYVFLLSTESFSKAGRQQLEACRNLGIGPWESFLRVAIPIASPAIGAGVALMSMEVMNELGAVQLLNIPSISAGIVESWIVNGEPAGSVLLALIGLTIVMTLVAYEKKLRSQSRRWSENTSGAESPKWEINGWREISAQIITFTPPFITISIPIFWVLSNADQISKGFNFELLVLTSRSLSISLFASFITILFALILTISKRWNNKRWLRVTNFLAGIGYAIPGAVLSLSLFPFAANPWRIAPIILLIWGYSIRFLAVAKGGFDAALERMPPTLDEAGTALGCSLTEITRRVHLPLLKGPIGVAMLLVFVDVLKELPISFTLRPFDFDTLSVRIFQYAGDERMAEAIIPALIILALGLIASLALTPSLAEERE